MRLNKVILEPSVTKKGIYGIKHCQDGLIFYKDNIKYLENNQDFFRKSEFDYSPVVMLDKEKHVSYFEFDDDLYCNTLYDTLYFNGKYWNKRKKWFASLKNSMSKNYKIMDIKDTNSKKFFIDRIENIKDSVDYSVNKELLLDVYNFMMKIDNYSFRSYVSNGDLTDTNICLNSKICDTECFGYNNVVCDLAIFFISILYGRWIYPKYNFQAYVFRKNKIVSTKLKLNNKQKDLLFRIIDLVKPVEFETFKKFLIMRLVTPIGLNVMDSNDIILVDGLMRVIALSNIKNIVRNIIEYAN